MNPEGPHSTIYSNGLKIPRIGFGTYGMNGSRLAQLTAHALRAGFRHIDTAQIYGNEEAVGEGFLASGVHRDEVFITTKVWVGNYPGGRFEQSVDESLKRLRMDYVDLLLLH